MELPRHRLRYTVLDASGAVSFIGPAHLLKMFAASCAAGSTDILNLFDGAAAFDAEVAFRLKRDLRIFDEHFTSEDHPGIDEYLDREGSRGPFRVVGESTRLASMLPDGAGLVIFNLPQRRIVQVQNTYANLRRQDRGRTRVGGKPTGALYRYRLPEEWSILP